ncbi:substrate-binding domain-containing protein [Actinomadura sp. WMMA1423]|uniref:substrate-binding domain-containing protein n=1 Tax=Actinomadura sp. WMMA1423 TaxID=2591108 RepID=UPI0011466B6D
MSAFDDVPEWAPRTPPEPGGPESPHVFLGASHPGPLPRRGRGGSEGEPFDAFKRPGRTPRPQGPAHAAAKSARGPWSLGGGRPPRRVGGILLGPLAGAVGLVLLGGFGAYALASAGGGCSGGGAVTLDVAVAPDVAAAVARAADRFNDAGHEVDGRCARARVRATDPAAVATLLSGKGVAGVARRPDVWIPDSSLWTKLVEGPAQAARPRGTRAAWAGSPRPRSCWRCRAAWRPSCATSARRSGRPGRTCSPRPGRPRTPSRTRPPGRAAE